jgi:hypothetical protein
MAEYDIIYKGNDQHLQVSGLADGLTAAWVNDAVVTATLKDSASAVVTGINALSLSYIAASNGNYRGAIPDTFNPAEGYDYTLEITATQGGTTVGFWVRPAWVKVRVD